VSEAEDTDWLGVRPSRMQAYARCVCVCVCVRAHTHVCVCVRAHTHRHTHTCVGVRAASVVRSCGLGAVNGARTGISTALLSPCHVQGCTSCAAQAAGRAPPRCARSHAHGGVGPRARSDREAPAGALVVTFWSCCIV
jgi:hypothetical protein